MKVAGESSRKHRSTLEAVETMVAKKTATVSVAVKTTGKSSQVVKKAIAKTSKVEPKKTALAATKSPRGISVAVFCGARSGLAESSFNPKTPLNLTITLRQT